ncbi:Fic family protein [Gemella sp. GH3]|uniref:Fic family protein n=1 Tax=unclassified Gemella TaxID=2624949 RepID=UPI0015CFBB3A|nr:MULTISPECIES: Fic family protein [unclassified Gemella]MBF0714485.1 Fic family protein [Gemella sp. GH3.1]NYS51437.1 Fic family protein [Gemella sp. GH3]
MLKGVLKLPVIVSDKEALIIFKKLSAINKKIGKLDVSLKKSLINSSLLSLLMYNESVQSTKIEGTQVTFHEIMESQNRKNKSLEEIEVENYRKAIKFGVNEIKEGSVITSKLIKKLHTILMDNARGTTANKGEFRKIQNHIGPDEKIENATYIPINANEIPEYMTNLEYFINGEMHRDFQIEIQDNNTSLDHSIDSLLRICIMHAQFESIHPFLDGNGRLGRILIALMAVQEEIMDSPLFFVSEELEKERIRYYNSLNGTRGDDPDWITWIHFFLNASERMADKILKKIDDSDNLALYGLSKCKTEIQKNVWLETFKHPIVTSNIISKITGNHQSTVKKALDNLVDLGLLDKDKSMKRNVKYYNYDLLRIISQS